MFFKKTFIFLFLSFFFLSCSWKDWYGEKTEHNTVFDASQFLLESCSLDFKTLSTKFAEGTLEEKDINHNVDCALKLLGDSKERLITKFEGAVTEQEIKTLIIKEFLPKVASGAEDLDLWLNRIFSFRKLILGDAKQKQPIRFSEMEEILTRFRSTSPHIALISQGLKKRKTLTLQSKEIYVEERKLFSLYMKVIKSMLQNENGEIVNNLSHETVFEQYNYWSGLDKGIGKHYIEAAFLAHKLLYGSKYKTLLKENISSLLDGIEKMYHTFSEIHYYSHVPLISTESATLFLVNYYKLLDHVFTIFENKKQKRVFKNDLVQLFELLQTRVQGKASVFVAGLFELKMRVCGGNTEILTDREMMTLHGFINEVYLTYESALALFEEDRENISQAELSQWIHMNQDRFIDQSVIDTYQKMEANFPRITHYWQTPIDTHTHIPKYHFIFSHMTLAVIDRIISAYDSNVQDVVPIKELNAGDLISLSKTLQLLVKGFVHLVNANQAEEPSGVKIDNEESEIIARALGLLTDRFFKSSDSNGVLDHFELLDAISFLFENRRLARTFFESHKTNETVSGTLILNNFAWSADELTHILKAFNKSPSDEISFKDTELIYFVIRFVDMIFEKYDVSKDAVLDLSELDSFYNDFNAFFGRFVEAKIQKNKEANYYFWQLWFADDNETFMRKFFDYALLFGEVTAKGEDLSKLEGQTIQTNRLLLVDLITSLFKKAELIK